MCAKFFAHICTISLKLCVEPVVCARRSRILRALIAFSCRQQLIKYRLFTTKTSCFFNAFLTHLRDLFPNRAWSLSSALGDREYFVLSSPSLASSSSMVYFVIGDCRRRYCLFWFFQLEDIVDFPLIHRPYGFIVQFLMINTGNGGSFVQL